MPATLISFDFTGSAPSGTSMNFTQDGLSLTVSSALYHGEYLADRLVYEYSTPVLSMTSQGIGALNPYDDIDQGFDAHGKFEMATFAFSQTVRITSVTLIPIGNKYNPNAIDTEFVLFDQGLVYNEASRQYIDPTDFINSLNFVGSYLGIAAVTHLDNFYLAGITVELIGTSGTTVADSFAIKTSDAPKVLNVLANDTGMQQITGINTTALLGAVTLAADGLTLSYDAGSAFDYLAFGATATETFTYTALAADGHSETQTVTITVTGNPNVVTGTAVANTLNGSGARDVITGLAGNDTINGLGGNDDIDGGRDRDLLHGNDGNDVVNGGDGDDSVYGDAGNDTVIGGAGTDVLYGGDGNDSIDGSNGADRMFGDAGNDVLVGGASANVLDGGLGADTMTGGAGNDSYYVDDAGDLIVEFAGGGADLVRSTVSFILGDNVENLTLTGAAAVNGSGNALSNRLIGNDANNALFGFGANDRLEGGLGDDALNGGTGRDILVGGAGADSFVFAEYGSANYDSILDFNGLVDSIQLDGAAFGLDAGALMASEFINGTKALTSSQHFIYNQWLGDLYYDADGSGAGVKQLILSLADGTALSYDDIFGI